MGRSGYHWVRPRETTPPAKHNTTGKELRSGAVSRDQVTQDDEGSRGDPARSRCSGVEFKCCFPWFNSELEQLSAMLGLFLGSFPFDLHGLADGRFRCCRKGPEGLRFWSFQGVFGSFLCCSVRRFIARHSDMCWDPLKLDFLLETAKSVEDLNCFN